MQRLPQAVRTCLLLDASLPAAATARWSLESLAALNNQIDSEEHASLPTETQTTGQAIRRKPPSITKGGLPRKEVAWRLLREVRIRLAWQHDICLRMLSHAEESNFLPLDNVGGDTISVSLPTGPVDCNRNRPIRAVNQTVTNMSSPLEQLQRQAQHEQEKMKALKAIRDLEMLHADTYNLIHQLLPHSGSASNPLERFADADRSLVAATFEQVRSRHALTVETLAEVVAGQNILRQQDGNDVEVRGGLILDYDHVETFLRGRLGVQLLCDHYVSYAKQNKEHGSVTVNCDVLDVLDDAATEARHICDANLGAAPDVDFLVRGAGEGHENGENDPIRLTLIRPWVHHALVELLKNAMASSVQKAEEQGEKCSPPPVNVRILDNLDCVCFNIVDRGVGLTPDSKRRAFRFAETSSLERWDRLQHQQSYAAVRSPLSGLGVGLPISRMMMQMFGGNVLISDNIHTNDNESNGQNRGSGCIATISLRKNSAFQEWDHSISAGDDWIESDSCQ